MTRHTALFPSLVCVVLLSCALVPLHLHLSAYPDDDAYIHIRIAQHLADGRGPFFNPSDAVNADSAAAWVILVAIGLRLFGHAPQTVAILNALATAFGVVVYVQLLRAFAPRLQPIHSVAFGAVYLALVLPTSTALMETPMALLLAGLALVLLQRNEERAFLLFGLLPFFRPELILLSGLAWLYSLSANRVRAAIYILLGALPLTAWEAFWFRTLIPHSMVAKSKVYVLSVGDTASAVLGSLLRYTQFSFSTFLFQDIANLLLTFLLFVVLLRSIWLLVHPNPQMHALVLAVLAFWPCVILGYALSRTFIFAWYVPLYSVPLFFAAFILVAVDPLDRVRAALKILLIPVTLALLVRLAVTAGAGTLFPTASNPNFATGARVRKYIQVGQDLDKRCPGQTLLTSEIGGLGYGFTGRIIDGAGLVSPEALTFHPLRVPDQRSSGSVGAIPARLVEQSRPDLIVGYDIFMEEFATSPAARNYVRIQEPIYLPDDLRLTPVQSLWGSQSLNVFVRKDLIDSGLCQYSVSTLRVE